ncbi:SDR family NAD(P)-dependent oxidoreductase [Caulobacter sp. 1776]|uniref:SDR family NAD(P)-dependent oxidoreductase n=1 Tax=Caulobacter sp. 1776 TaxID=3156420 RepID=UPI003395AD42
MFKDKTVLLTGGSGGLGSRIAAQLAQEGAQVVILGRSLPAGGGAFLRHDLSTVEGIEAAAAAVALRDWDIVVNLAGAQHFGPLERQAPDHLVASYMINLVAPVRLVQAVLPRMKAAGGGQIVNVGSIFGSINFAHFVTYSSAKAGLRGFSQALRRELSGTGIDVTYVAPRAVRTALITPAVMEFAKLTQMNMDPPERIARRIVEAMRTRERDVYFGFPESLFVRINALFPRLVDGALSANDRKAARLFSH